MMLTSSLENLGVLDAAIVALLGYAVVFFGLILLMIVVILLGKAFMAKEQKIPAAAPAAAPAAVEVAAAPGSAGQIKMYDVESKTAAMLMAIVANQMGKPLNELRFISIKEVK